MRARDRLNTLVIAIVAATTLVARATPTPSRNPSTYVILGLHGIKMKDFAFTNLGNVGVNDAGGTMIWGKKSFFGDGSQVTTDVLLRAGKNSSLWDLFANTVVSPLAQAGAVVRDQGPIPWSPLPLITPLAPVPSCTPGTTVVDVPKAGALSLAPGAYGAISVENGGTLDLTGGGAYCFADLKVGRKSTIVIDAPVDVTVTGRVRVLPGGVIKPGNSGLGATDIAIGVAGKQVKFSGKTRVSGVVYAPNALLRFGRGGFYTGQFIALLIRSDFGDTFTLQVCGNGVVDPGEQCDAGGGNGRLGSCCSSTCTFDPEGTPCPDGDRCDGDEFCSAAGQCVPGTPPDCNLNDPCKVDSCVPATGCAHQNKPDDTPCPDGNVCNGAEVCISGTCTDGPVLDCDDHNPCTDPDTCDPVLGCQNPPVSSPIPGCECPNGDSDCDNHNVCDGTETCDVSHQFCHPGTPLTCTTANQCLIAGCDATDGCITTPKSGASCDDADACTTNDVCTGDTCGGSVRSCDDGDPCTTDACDTQTGCSNTPIPGCGTGSTLCTLTQGAYGNSNGAANGGQGWVTNNPSILPAAIGAPGTGASVTVNTQAGLIAFLPTNGSPAVLNPVNGDVVITVAGDVPDPNGSGSNGDGAGTLAGQTLVMALNVAMSNLGANPPGLGSYPLSASICTCDGNGAQTGQITIPACVLEAAGTVNDLLSIANHVLAGEALSDFGTCTYSDIETALDDLNKGFDGCSTACSCQ